MSNQKIKTVKQLIEILSKFDPNLPVYFDYDHGYQQYELHNIYRFKHGVYEHPGKWTYRNCVMIETEFTSPNWDVVEDSANYINLNDPNEFYRIKKGTK